MVGRAGAFRNGAYIATPPELFHRRATLPTLIATMRNEGPFILEWLAYHRLIGFERVVACSNDCVDDSPALLDALAGEGLLTHVACRPPHAEEAQLFAYRAVQAMLAPAPPEWAMVLDADEFLNVHAGGGRVGDLIDAVGDATAVMVNWRVFGSNGHAHWSPEPVIERFTRAAPIEHGVNWSYKTLFRHWDAYYCPLMAHGPGYAGDEAVAGLRPVNGAGQALDERYARSAEFLQSEPGTVSWALAQVNHYNTRSAEDYRAKHHRGGGVPVRWDRDEQWAVWNRNDEEDRSIAHWLPAVRAEVAAMLKVPAVAAAYRATLNGYAAHVEGLRA